MPVGWGGKDPAALTLSLWNSLTQELWKLNVATLVGMLMATGVNARGDRSLQSATSSTALSLMLSVETGCHGRARCQGWLCPLPPRSPMPSLWPRCNPISSIAPGGLHTPEAGSLVPSRCPRGRWGWSGAHLSHAGKAVAGEAFPRCCRKQ